MSSIVEYIRTQPVVVAGAVLSLLTAIYEAGVADGFTLAVVVPIALAFITRMFTVPTSRVIDLSELETQDEPVQEDEFGPLA